MDELCRHAVGVQTRRMQKTFRLSVRILPLDYAAVPYVSRVQQIETVPGWGQECPQQARDSISLTILLKHVSK